MEIISEFRNLEQELLNNPRVGSIKLDLFDPISSLGLEIFWESFSLELQKGFLDFYKKSNGLAFEWFFNIGEKIGGEAKIRSLLDTFSDTGEGVIWYKEMKMEKNGSRMLEFCQRLRIFDRYETAMQSTRFVAFEIENNKIGTLWFWDTEGDKYPLSLQASDYFPNLIHAKAALNWQLFYIDLPRIKSFDSPFGSDFFGTTTSATINAMEEFLQTFSASFSNHPLEKYEKKYQQVKKEFRDNF